MFLSLNCVTFFYFNYWRSLPVCLKKRIPCSLHVQFVSEISPGSKKRNDDLCAYAQPRKCHLCVIMAACCSFRCYKWPMSHTYDIKVYFQLQYKNRNSGMLEFWNTPSKELCILGMRLKFEKKQLLGNYSLFLRGYTVEKLIKFYDNFKLAYSLWTSPIWRWDGSDGAKCPYQRSVHIAKVMDIISPKRLQCMSKLSYCGNNYNSCTKRHEL